MRSDHRKLTADVTDRLAEKPESRQGTFDLHSVTVRDMTGAITDVVTEFGHPEDKEEAPEDGLVKIFEGCAKSAGQNTGRRR